MIGAMILLANEALAAQLLPPTPSGTELRLYDTRLAGGTAHLRYVAPAPLSFDVVEPDFLWACQTMQRDLPGAHEIVVVISDSETEFGASDPEVTQFFELFEVTNGECIWRAF